MSIRILVGDADVLFADALSSVLRDYPDLDVADERPTSGVAAIECARRLAPDVALLDYWLRGMDGPAVIRSLRVHANATKVVNLAWFHFGSDVEEALISGAAGFLGKDVGVDQVVDVVRAAHDGRPTHSPEVAAQLTRMAAGRPDANLVARRLAQLTPRQLEILHLIANGLDVADICERLGLAEGTVRGHLHKVMSKIGAHSQVEAIAIAHHFGLV